MVIDCEPDQNRNVIVIDDSEDVVCMSDAINIKRHRPMKDFDIISGSYSFIRTVTKSFIPIRSAVCLNNIGKHFPIFQSNADRIYMVNGKGFKLKKEHIDRLLYYNKSPTCKNNTNIDKTYVELLLLSAFSVSDLKKGDVNIDLLNVIKGWSNI